MFPKPTSTKNEKKPYNSLQGRKKERKPIAEWKQNLFSHHISKTESQKEGDDMITQAFKECKECGWADLIPTRTMNCPNCETKSSLINKPEGLKRSKERLCECGCGEKVYVPKRFVSGHNGKLNSKPGTYRRDGRTYTLIKCYQCGIKFERRADSVNKHGLRNYCSKECMGLVQSKDRKGKSILSLRTGKELKCLFCGEEYYENKSKIDRGSKYCSKKCYIKDLANKPVAKGFIGSANNSGKNNGMYKHGKRTGGNTSKRKLREKIIERDGGKWCLICGKPGPGLHLHRIIYGSQCGKYEIDNCVQLCNSHHAIVHSNKSLWQPPLLAYIKDKIAELSADFRDYIKDILPQMDIVEESSLQFGYGNFDD
ncbi:MAG: Pascal47 [Paenibacillus sp.]|jgi:hypothetical protein|nr:Pascal47 [Paenibacillus sp.]